MPRYNAFDLQASAFGLPGIGTSPGVQRERSFLTFSAVSSLTTGSSVIMVAPGANKRYNIWGFTLDVSSASALDVHFQNDLGVNFFHGITFNTGNGYLGSKNAIFNLPLDCGANRPLLMHIVGPGAVTCISGIYYTITDID